MIARFIAHLSTRFGISQNAVLVMLAAAMLLASFTIYAKFYRRSSAPETSQYYYSTNNGLSFFRSDSIHIPPFRWHGKVAYQAGVFVNQQGSPFVAYVLRYTPTGQGILAGLPKIAGRTVDNSQMRLDAAKYCRVRPPGTKTWFQWNSPAGQRIVNPLDSAADKPAARYCGD